MNGWIKNFADGTQEFGWDHLVQRKEASWSRGRLDGMTCLELHHGRHRIFLEGIGSFWQSDDYEVKILERGASLKIRRIQKRIEETDRYISFDHIGGTYVYRVSTLPNGSSNVFHIDQNTRGKWLTIELSTETGQVIWDYKESKI